MGCKATKAKGREDAKDGGQLPASGSTLTTGSDLAAQGRTREVVLKTDAEQAAQEYQQIVKAKQDAEAARSKRKRVDDFDPIRPLDSFNITHRALLGRCWDQRQTELPSLILVQKVASMAAAEMTALQGNHGNGGGAYALAAKDFSTAAAVAQDNPAGSPLNHSLNGDGGMDGPGSPLVPGIGRGMARRSHWFTLLSAARKSSEVGGSGGPNPALAGLPEPLCNARAFSDITLEQITSLNGEQREILFNTLAAPRFDGIKEAYAFRLSEQLDSSEDTKFLRSRNLKPAKGLTVDRWNRVDFFHPNFNTLVRAAYATKGKSTATVTTTAAASPLMAGQRAGNASGLGSFNGSGLTNSFDQHIISERENSSFNTNPVASPLGPSTHHHFPGVCALESGPLTEEMKVRQPFPTESLLGMAMGIPSQRIAQLAGIPQLLQQQQNLLSPDAVSVDESSSGSSTSGGGTQPLVALCISSFSVGIDPFRWKEHRYTRRPIDVDSSKPSTRRTYGEGIVTDVMYGGVIVVECSSPESARELERMLKGLQWSEARSVRAIVADVRKVFKTLREERLARRNSTSSSPNGSPFHVACATNLGIPEEEDDRYRMWLRVGGRPMRDNVEFKEITVFLESNNGGMTSNGTSRTASPVVPRRGSFPDAAAADNNTTFSRVASAWVDLPTIASVLRTWGLHLLGNPEYSQPISLYLQRYAGVGLALQHKTLSSFRNGAEMSSEEEDESASPNEVDGGGFYEEDEGYLTAIKDGGGVVSTSRSKHPISKFNRFYTSARSSSLQLSDQGQGHKAQRNGGVGGPRLGGVLSRATTASSASSLHPPPRGLSAQTLPGVGHAHQLSASSSRSLSLDSSSSSSSSSEAAAPPGDASTVLSRESTGVFHDRSCLASFAGPGAAAAGGRCAKRQGPPGHHHHHHHQRAKAATAAKPLRNPVRQGLAKKPPLPSKAKTSPTAATPSGSSTAATVTAATSTPTSAAAVAAIKKSGKDIGTPGSPKGPLHNASIISTASTQIMVGNGSINRSIVLSPTMARLRASSGSPSHGVNSPARRTDLEQVWYMADLELKAQQVELEETRQAKLEAEKRLNARQKDLQTLHRAFLPQSTESELDLTFLYLKTAIYDSDELPDNRLYLDQPDWLPLLMAVWTNPANLVRSVSISASLTWRDLPKLGILGSLLYHDHAGSSLHALEINAEYLFGAPLPVAGGVASAAPAAAPSPVVLDFRSSLSLLATGGASGAGPVSSSSTPPFFISPAQARDLLLTLLCAVGDNNVHDGFVFTLRGFPAGADKSSGGGGGGLGGLLPFTSKRGSDVGGEGLLLQQGSLNLEGFAVKSGSTPELSFDRNPTVYEVVAENSAGPLTRREDSRSFYGSPEPREWAAVEEDGVPLHVHGKLKRKWIKEATKVEVLPFCNILYHTCSGLQNNEYYVGHYHHPYNEVHHHRDYFLTGARRQKLTALEAAEAAWCAERRRQGHAVAGRVKVATTAKMAASMYNVFGLLSREEEESIFKEEAALLFGHAGTIWEVLRKSVKHYNHDVAVAKAKRRETAGMGTKSGGKAPPCLPRIILART